jgi:hypothetical protein
MDATNERSIRSSLHTLDNEELQQMSDQLTKFINVLIGRQVIIEEVILERLEASFAK